MTSVRRPIRKIKVNFDFVFVVESAAGDAERTEKVRRTIRFILENCPKRFEQRPYINKEVKDVRARLIVYGAGSEAGMPQITESGFYDLTQQEAFAGKLDSIDMYPQPKKAEAVSCAMTALEKAFESPWCTAQNGEKCRHVVVMFVGSAQDSEQNRQRIDECEEKWEQQMDLRSKRMILFCDGYSGWGQATMWCCSLTGEGWLQTAQEEFEEEILRMM